MAAVQAENEALIKEIVAAPVDDKGFIDDELRTAVFRRLRVRPENRTCFDCPARNPTWISLSHANYVCLVCRYNIMICQSFFEFSIMIILIYSSFFLNRVLKHD